MEIKTLSFTQDYKISNTGEILSLKTNKVLKPYLMPSGYEQITLRIEGKSKKYYVHRLVAEHFIENPEGKPEVNHIDGNKSNNNVVNLEWVTPTENQLHKKTIGKGKTSNKKVGKFTLDGELVIEYESVVEAAKQEGCAEVSIYNVCYGKRKTLFNHVWKYLDKEIVQS